MSGKLLIVVVLVFATLMQIDGGSVKVINKQNDKIGKYFVFFINIKKTLNNNNKKGFLCCKPSLGISQLKRFLASRDLWRHFQLKSFLGN